MLHRTRRRGPPPHPTRKCHSTPGGEKRRRWEKQMRCIDTKRTHLPSLDHIYYNVDASMLFSTPRLCRPKDLVPHKGQQVCSLCTRSTVRRGEAFNHAINRNCLLQHGRDPSDHATVTVGESYEPSPVPSSCVLCTYLVSASSGQGGPESESAARTSGF